MMLSHTNAHTKHTPRRSEDFIAHSTQKHSAQKRRLTDTHLLLDSLKQLFALQGLLLRRRCARPLSCRHDIYRGYNSNRTTRPLHVYPYPCRVCCCYDARLLLLLLAVLLATRIRNNRGARVLRAHCHAELHYRCFASAAAASWFGTSMESESSETVVFSVWGGCTRQVKKCCTIYTACARCVCDVDLYKIMGLYLRLLLIFFGGVSLSTTHSTSGKFKAAF